MNKELKKEALERGFDYPIAKDCVEGFTTKNGTAFDFIRGGIVSFRIFIAPKEAVIYDCEEASFKKMSLYNFIDSKDVLYRQWKEYGRNDDIVVSKSAYTLLGKDKEISYYSAYERIVDMMKYANNTNRRLLREKELANIKARQRIFEKKNIPGGYDDFGRKLFYGQYNMLFDRERGAITCPVCGVVHSLDKFVKQNAEWKCPSCKATGKCKSQKSANSQYKAEWSILAQTSGESVLFRYFVHSMKQEKDGSVKWNKREHMRTEIKENATFDYEYKNGQWDNYHEPTFSYYVQPSEFDYPKNGATLYRANGSFEKLGWLKYSGIGLFMKKYAGILENTFLYEQYIDLYKNVPMVEAMVKQGFFTLLRNLKSSYNGIAIDESQHKIIKFLKLNKDNFKILCEYKDPTPAILSLLQYITEKNYHVSSKDFHEIMKLKLSHSVQKEKILDHIQSVSSWYMLNKYMSEKADNDYVSYFDYIGWTKELGYKKNDSTLYPKDFKVAHDRVFDEYTQMKDKIERKKKTKISQKIAKQYKEKTQLENYHFEEKGMLIALPKGIKDLQDESRELNHCVKSYDSKVANGETEIFFVRKANAPKKPYFTLEIKDKKIVQCRTYNNDYMKGDVEKFAFDFLKHLTQPPKNVVNA